MSDDDTLHPSSTEDAVALDDLIESTGLRHEEVIELVELGVLEPCGGTTRLAFYSHTVIQGRRAARLRDDFGLNTPGIALALTYLERIERLERRLRELEAARLR
jgi:chaperone modulatory protein CbpM